MAEGLAENKHLPGKRISRVYGEWAKGGWGALLTGKPILHIPKSTGYRRIHCG